MRKISLLLALLVAGIARGQRGAGDWMTSAFDAQRSSWVRNDAKISPESMAKPGFNLVWKMKLFDQPGKVNNFGAPALLDFYIGYRGFRTLAFFGSGLDKVTAVDTDLARVEWQNKYADQAQPAGTAACSSATSGAAVTRPTITSYPPPPLGRGAGRGAPAKSGVGAPHEGSVVLTALASRPRPTPPPPPSDLKPARAPQPSAFDPHVQSVLALTADGKLHSGWVSNGNEPNPAMQFIPANAHAVGLIAYDNTAYVATTGGCGDAGNGLWSIDLATHKVKHWNSNKDIAGTAGPAVGPDGTLYIGAGSDLVALSPGELETIAVYKSSGAEFSSSPVVFEFKGRNLIAIASNDGRLHLVDAGSLNGETPLHRSSPFSNPGYATGSLASWLDPAGTRWILAAAGGSVASTSGFGASNGAVTHGAIVAWKVIENNGVPELVPGWISRDMMAPLPPIVVSGVVFALSSGAVKSNSGSLYALDALSGKELWSSGAAIESAVPGAGLAAGGTRVYVSTNDGTQYVFGFPIEH